MRGHKLQRLLFLTGEEDKMSRDKRFSISSIDSSSFHLLLMQWGIVSNFLYIFLIFFYMENYLSFRIIRNSTTHFDTAHFRSNSMCDYHSEKGVSPEQLHGVNNAKTLRTQSIQIFIALFALESVTNSLCALIGIRPVYFGFVNQESRGVMSIHQLNRRM